MHTGTILVLPPSRLAAMTPSSPQSSAKRSASAENSPPRPPLPVWKKLAFMAALLLGLAGLALTRTANDTQPAPGGTGTDVGAASLTAGGTQVGEAQEEVNLWAPLAMKGGLAFAVAFAIGFALRTFMTLTMVVLGVVALAIFGLQKAGIVSEIDWTIAQGHWDKLTANIGQQVESFKSFVSGSLPSAGAGTVGLISGFRR
jgi:uncharacterized membrane protein (Fun14 family)